jgi:hypothetical protein
LFDTIQSRIGTFSSLNDLLCPKRGQIMQRYLVLGILTAAVYLGAVQSAVASPLDFQYGTTVTPSPINPTSTIGGPGSQISQAGIGNFTSPTAPTYNAGLNGSLGTDITVGTINVTDLSIGAYTDTYGPTTITVSLKLKDVDSGSTGVFQFTGTLTGQVSSNGTTTSSSMDNPFTASSQIQNIGGTNYEVRIIPSKDFTAPGSPPVDGTGFDGVYSFNVLEAPTVPEPASLLLLTFAGLPMVLLRRRVGGKDQEKVEVIT